MSDFLEYDRGMKRSFLAVVHGHKGNVASVSCVLGAALVLGLAPPAVAETVNADLDGDGASEAVRIDPNAEQARADVTLSGTGSQFELDLGFVPLLVHEPFVRLVRNVDGRPGDEVLVHVSHISTYDGYAFLTYAGGGLRLSSSFDQNVSLGDGYAMGFRCWQNGGVAGVTTYSFGQVSLRGKWKRYVRRYQWADGALTRVGPTRRSVVRRPRRIERGIHC